MVVLMLVAGSLYLTFVFSYLYLWTVSPQAYPPAGAPAPPTIDWPLTAAALMIASVTAFVAADRALPAPHSMSPWTPLLTLLGAACLGAGVVLEIFGHWHTGLRATDTSYGAMVYMASILNGELALTVALMAGYTLARFFTGKVDSVRRVTFENTALLTYYTAGQGLFGLVLIHGFPRLLG